MVVQYRRSRVLSVGSHENTLFSSFFVSLSPFKQQSHTSEEMSRPTKEEYKAGRVFFWDARGTTNYSAYNRNQKPHPATSSSGAREHAFLILEVKELPTRGLVATKTLYITGEDHPQRNRVQIRFRDDSKEENQKHLQFNREWTKKRSYLMCESCTSVPLSEASYSMGNREPIFILREDWKKILRVMPDCEEHVIDFESSPPPPPSDDQSERTNNKNSQKQFMSIAAKKRQKRLQQKAESLQGASANSKQTERQVSIPKLHGIPFEAWMDFATDHEISAYISFARFIQNTNRQYQHTTKREYQNDIERYLTNIQSPLQSLLDESGGSCQHTK